MFLRRSRTTLVVAPVTWLATGCFLGGDYFTEQAAAEVSAASTSSEESALPTEESSSSSAFTVTSTPPTEPTPPGSSVDVQSTENPGLSTSGEQTLGTESQDVTSGLSHNGPDSGSRPPSTSAAASDTTSEGTQVELTSGMNSSDTSSFTADSDPCDRFGCPEPCAPGEQSGPGGRCYWFSAAPVSWDVARSTCAARGSGWTLVTIHTEAEDDFVASHINGDTWIGAEYSAGTWRWMNDTSPFPKTNSVPGDGGDYANWGTNEPSGSRGENCVRYHSYNDRWRWGDTECDEGRFGVACEGP